MPIDKYYKGHGEEVMTDMTKRYGAKKGKSIFYATANSRPGMKPEGEKPAKPAKSSKRYHPVAEG